MSTPDTGIHASKSVNIGGQEFILRPLPVFRAAAINANLTAVLGPLLLGQVRNVSELILGLGDERLSKLLGDLFSSTVYRSPTLGNMELSDSAAMDAAFSRNLEGVYDLAMEVLEYNQFPFFAKLRKLGAAFVAKMDAMPLSPEAMEALTTPVAGTGSETTETDTSEKPTASVPRTPAP